MFHGTRRGTTKMGSVNIKSYHSYFNSQNVLKYATMNGQIAMLAESKQNVYESSGVTRENTGSSTGDQSGRAILAKQQQGSVTTAELFDNFRQTIVGPSTPNAIALNNAGLNASRILA